VTRGAAPGSPFHRPADSSGRSAFPCLLLGGTGSEPRTPKSVEAFSFYYEPEMNANDIIQPLTPEGDSGQVSALYRNSLLW
jgi:hypothetical protein